MRRNEDKDEPKFQFKVGDYNTFLESENDYKSLKRKLLEGNEQNDPNQVMVDQLLNNEEKNELYTGINDKGINGQETTEARDKFIKYFEQQILNNPEKNANIINATTPKKDSILMKDFLEDEGMKLFQAAMEEERNSKSFRNAVFLRSTKFFNGHIDEQIELSVGGPSSSGKSFAKDNVVNVLVSKILPQSQNKKSIFFTAIDGGVEREVSQMRNLLVEGALKKGYPGISDLYDQVDNKGTKIKTLIKKCVNKSETIHQAIPDTFVRYLNPFLGYKDKKNKLHIFSEVVAPPGYEEYFRKMVALLGEKRAYKTKDYGEVSEDMTIKLDQKSEYEFKDYEPQHFDKGKKGTENAREKFKNKNKDGIYVKVINDLMCVKFNNVTKTFEEVEPQRGDDIVQMPRRTFDYFTQVKKKIEQGGSELKEGEENFSTFVDMNDFKIKAKNYTDKLPPYLIIYHKDKIIHHPYDPSNENKQQYNKNLSSFQEEMQQKQQEKEQKVKFEKLKPSKRSQKEKEQLQSLEEKNNTQQQKPISLEEEKRKKFFTLVKRLVDDRLWQGRAMFGLPGGIKKMREIVGNNFSEEKYAKLIEEINKRAAKSSKNPLKSRDPLVDQFYKDLKKIIPSSPSDKSITDNLLNDMTDMEKYLKKLHHQHDMHKILRSFLVHANPEKVKDSIKKLLNDLLKSELGYDTQEVLQWVNSGLKRCGIADNQIKKMLPIENELHQALEEKVQEEPKEKPKEEKPKEEKPKEEKPKEEKPKEEKKELNKASFNESLIDKQQLKQQLEQIKNLIEQKELKIGSGGKISKKVLQEKYNINIDYNLLAIPQDKGLLPIPQGKGSLPKLYVVDKGIKHNQQIGTGTYGIIKRVLDVDTREIAIAKIQLYKKENKEALDHEMQLAGKMGQIKGQVIYTDQAPTATHNINRFGIDEHQKHVSIMPLIPGVPIKFMTHPKGERSNFATELKLNAIVAMSNALSKVHKQNILHLDINPDNILYDTKTNQATIIDFGTSLALQEGKDNINGTFRGSLLYMAPEVKAKFQSKEYTEAVTGLNKKWDKISSGLINDIIKNDAKLLEIYNNMQKLNKDTKERSQMSNDLRLKAKEHPSYQKALASIREEDQKLKDEFLSNIPYSKANDIYSMGVLMAETMGWAKPDSKHRNDMEIKFPAEYDQNTSEGKLIHLLKSMTNKEPTQRPNIETVCDLLNNDIQKTFTSESINKKEQQQNQSPQVGVSKLNK